MIVFIIKCLILLRIFLLSMSGNSFVKIGRYFSNIDMDNVISK